VSTDDPVTWARIEAIFREALELEGDARRRFIDRRCAGDAALRAEVSALLDADAEAGSFLAEPAAVFAAGIPTEDPLEPPRASGSPETPVVGRRIGAYEITREIGRGGMGTVYLAARADGQFQQDVALKVLKRGMDSEDVQRRFLQERQILAWLKHPNIASLLDGGVEADGTLYFVMEYVAGVPLTRYCDERRFSIRDRLRLFREVCAGVQHAHVNLVVHRDLKPANVLVTHEGRVKLLDFGVAKLLETSDDGQLTRLESRVLTPQYAAPEQVLGGAITVATDVYALGIVLYELLTGRPPYVVPAGLGAERVILDEDPSLPSTVATKPDARDRNGSIGPEAIAAARSLSAGDLQKSLRGDLDNIVLKALRKSPAERYPSVEAFARDIEAYETDRPVLARPQSASYRARKFVRRHRVGVAAATFVLVTMLAGFAGVIWQARETAKEARKADASKQFLASLFEIADPSESGGRSITTRQLLDRGAARIETELASEPDVKAEVMATIGWMYYKLGAYDEARDLLERATAHHRGRGDEEYPRVLAALATVHQAVGEYDVAERCFRESLEKTKDLRGEEHLDVAYRMNDLAILLKDKGDRQEAERLQRQVLAMKRRLAGNDLATASTLNNLAVLVADRGELTEAEALYREALEIRRAKLGNDHLLVVNTLSNLLVLLRQREDFDAAEPLAREILDVRRRVQGDDHPDVAASLYNLAAILRARKNYPSAEPLFREAIARTKATKGADHPDVATMQVGLSSLLRVQGATAEAESLGQSALAIMDARLPRDHPARAAVLLELGQVFLEEGRAREAERLIGEARQLFVAKFGTESLQAADARLALGRCLARQGRNEEALREFALARDTFVTKLGPGRERTTQAERAIDDIAAPRREIGPS